MRAVLLLLAVIGAVAAEPVVSRTAWSFDRQGIAWAPWAKPEEAKKRGQLRDFQGWVAYDIEIPAAGWYSLWVDGQPTTWGFSVAVDGEEIWGEVGLTDADYEDPSAQGRQRGMLKKGNLQLRAGKHSIRLERLKFPGILPSRWELRAADRFGALRGRLEVPRVQPPGSEWRLTIASGAACAGQWEIVAANPVAGTETVVATVTLPRAEPMSFTLPGPGAWYLLPRRGDETGRPADLLGGAIVESAVVTPPEVAPEDVIPTTVELAGVFQNGGVLQQQKPLPVWGYAPPGAEVNVALAGQERTATADDRGRWRVTFAPLDAGSGPHELVATSGDHTDKVGDLLVGEVWLFSGQSNMGGGLSQAPNAEELIAAANWPEVRLGGVHDHVRTPEQPTRVRVPGWQHAAPHPHRGRQDIGRWNAISFAFSTTVHETLEVPVGVVLNNRGGTVISAWTSLETQEATPAFAPEATAFHESEANRTDLVNVADKVNGTVQGWIGKSAAKRGEIDIDKTVAQSYAREHKNDPANLYESLLEPLAPYAIRGFAWYQGESDSRRAWRYRQMLPAMIANWRDIWGDESLPFLIVQIAPGKGDPPTGAPEDSPSAEMREAQAHVAATVPNTALIVTNDLPVPGDDVHYKNKPPVGRRLAQAALGMVYSRDVAVSGPVFRELKVEDGKLRLFFDHLAGGLRVDGDTLRGFSIAGEDRVFHWAQATVGDDTVLVWSDAVPEPVAARYAWSNEQPGATLKNAAGLPASTFRTDNWPASTRDN